MLAFLSSRFLLEVKWQRSGFHCQVIRFGFMWIQFRRIKGDLNLCILPCPCGSEGRERRAVSSPEQTIMPLNKMQKDVVTGKCHKDCRGTVTLAP